MDIRKLAVAETAFLHLKGPDGALLFEGKEPVGIEMFSPATAQAADVDQALHARAFKRARKGDGASGVAPIEERRAESAQDLATLTAGFRHLERGDLSARDLYLAVYSDPTLGWIKEQAARFASDWGSFAARGPAHG